MHCHHHHYHRRRHHQFHHTISSMHILWVAEQSTFENFQAKIPPITHSLNLDGVREATTQRREKIPTTKFQVEMEWNGFIEKKREREIEIPVKNMKIFAFWYVFLYSNLFPRFIHSFLMYTCVCVRIYTWYFKRAPFAHSSPTPLYLQPFLSLFLFCFDFVWFSVFFSVSTSFFCCSFHFIFILYKMYNLYYIYVCVWLV